MHDPKGLPILFEDTEPLGPVRRILSFIDSDFNLLLYYFDDLIVYPWWYRNISFDPCYVLDCGDDNGLE